MKEKLEQIKEFVGKLSSKTKKLIIAGAALLLIAAVAVAFILNNQPYEVLFSGLGTEEAQQRIVAVIRRLEEAGEVIIVKSGKDEIIA